MQTRTVWNKIAVAMCALTVLGAGWVSAPSYAAHTGANAALNAEIKAAPKYSGKVLAVDATKGTITIAGKKKTPAMTFNVVSTTRIRVDKAKATLADIIVGKKATVRSDDKVTALAINQKTVETTPAPATVAATPAPTPAQ